MKNNKQSMTLKQWLKDTYYDEFGQYLWSKQDTDGGSQMIGEIRGWGALQHCFETEEEASKFQDEVGRFIVEAIREKIERDEQQERMYSEEEVKSAFKIGFNIGYGSPVQELDFKNEHCEKWFKQFKKK